MSGKSDLLLHICCAPCGGGCIGRSEMIDPGRRVTLFFSNSNLDSEEEFSRRLQPVRRLAEYFGLPLIVDGYDHGAWRAAVAGLEDAPEGGERCRRCFAFNLGRTAEAAKGGRFSTTLTVSPRKSSAGIFAAGAKWENFEAIDFKKKNGYLIGVRFAEKMGFYRQNYCGCEFSRRAGTINRGETNDQH